MLKLLNLDDASLAKLVSEIEDGQELFQQGDRALTMFIIVSGQLELLQRTGKNERLIDVVGPGEVLGEKAVISETPFRRNCAARARGTVTFVELDAKGFQKVIAKVPAFNHHILRTVITRLERANEMVGILQLRDPAERFIHHLLSLCRHSEHRRPNGVEIRISLDRLAAVLNLTRDYIRDCLDTLTTNQVLLPHKEFYIVTDENALLDFLPMLKDRVAA